MKKSNSFISSSPTKTQNFYLFFLSKIKGLGNATVWQFISNDISNPKIKQIISKHQQNKNFLQATQAEFEQINENYISILDPQYPDFLKTIYDPPLFLFYQGNIKLLQNKCLLTIVGSRTMTNYHYQMTKNLIGHLANTPLTIVSGLAIGIDALSHQSALDNKLPTIAVLGSGLDENIIYPQNNISLAKKILKNNGLLISEYSSSEKTQLHHFPKRNRILAGLSKATIVISGAKKSGTLITAQVAIDEGREILALPGNINLKLCQGPNGLIKNGASLLNTPQDILKLYNINKQIITKKIVFKNKLHAKTYSLLQTESITLIDLSAKMNLSLAETNIIASELEIKKLIKFNQFNQIEIL